MFCKRQAKEATQSSLSQKPHATALNSLEDQVDLVHDLEREFRPLAQLKGLRLETMIGFGKRTSRRA